MMNFTLCFFGTAFIIFPKHPRNAASDLAPHIVHCPWHSIAAARRWKAPKLFVPVDHETGKIKLQNVNSRCVTKTTTTKKQPLNLLTLICD
jgi:hypothetical protein